MSKQITIPLLEYLQDDIKVYTHYDTRIVSTARGILISELDKEENYVHVEFQGKYAVIWDRKFWKDSETRNTRLKEESDRRRRQYFLDEANIVIVCKAIAKMTGIKDYTLMKPLAVEIIKKQKFDTLPYLNLKDLKVREE